MKNTVNIIIEGETKSGKSRIGYVIKEILKVHGFNVEFDPSPDFVNEDEFNRTMRNGLDSAIETLTHGTNIVVKEIQTNR